MTDDQPPVDYVLPPSDRQVLIRIRCPFCGTTDVRSNGWHGGIAYFRCKKCIKPGKQRPEPGSYTTFKVPIV